MRIRNHVIEVFERADAEPDPGRRRALLPFVVAGGGFSGAELAGGLNDFARGIIADYPNISADYFPIIPVHSGERILPKFSEPPSHYTVPPIRHPAAPFNLSPRSSHPSP